MKTKFSNADVAKREFYATVQKRKEEVEDVLRYLNDPKHKGYLDFEAWYTQEWDWRFLRDILGGQQKLGMPWDYNNLIHKPTINGHTLTYGMSSVDAGLLSADYLDVKNGLTKEIIPDDEGNDHLWLGTDITVGTDEAPLGSEVASWLKFNDKVYTFGSSSGGDVTKAYVDENLALKQNKVIYQEDEPESSVEGDLWAFKSEYEPISYDDLDDKPSINNVQLQGDVSLDDIVVYSKWLNDSSDKTKTTYSASKVDSLIATANATFRGTFTASAAELADPTAYINAKMVELGITPDKNDYVYLNEQGTQVYKKYQYDGTSAWAYVIEIDLSGSAISIQLVYPVGSIYMTTNNVNPSVLFVGTTWERIESDTYLVSGDYTGKPVGSNTHTLTISEMPVHDHNIGTAIGTTTGYVQCNNTAGFIYNGGNAEGIFKKGTQRTVPLAGGRAETCYDIYADISNHRHTCGSAGNGSEFNIQPKSLQVYMWVRIA